jgi:DNA-directed RNA polymerase specialized sigma24 family protein
MPDTLPADCTGASTAQVAVTRLYELHAVGLIRLAMVMLGDRPSAEDAVQDAFCGLYRRYGSLVEPGRARPYVRSSVLNGCRSQLRARQRDRRRSTDRGSPPPNCSSAGLMTSRCGSIRRYS